MYIACQQRKVKEVISTRIAKNRGIITEKKENKANVWLSTITYLTGSI